MNNGVYQDLFDMLLQIPQTLSTIAVWLTTPITIGLIVVTPLGLFTASGIWFLIGIVAWHLVRVFI